MSNAMPGVCSSRSARRWCASLRSWRLVAAFGCAILLPTQHAAGQNRVAAPDVARTDAARAESLAAAAQAWLLLSRHDALGAMAAAYQGLPEFKGAGWPDVPQTRQALLAAYSESHLVAAYDRKASAAALSRDGKRIAIALEDGVEVRSLDPDARLAFLRLPTSAVADEPNQINFLDIAADGRHVLAANTHAFWVWPLDGAGDAAVRSGNCTAFPLLEAARFVGDGARVLVKCGSDLKILDAADLRAVMTLDEVNAFDVSLDGRLIATDKGVRALVDGKAVLTFPPSSDPALLLAFAPDGRSLATARDRIVTIWSLTEAKPTRGRPSSRCKVRQGSSWIAYAPDGKALVTLNGGEIRVWDLESGALTAVWADNRINRSAETPALDRAYVSADGHWLLTASNWQDGMYTTKSTVWNLLHLDAPPVRVTRGGGELPAAGFTHGAVPMFATVDRLSPRGGVFVWSAESNLLLHRWRDDVIGTAAFVPASNPSNDIILRDEQSGALMRCRFDSFACERVPSSTLGARDDVIAAPNGKAVVSLQGQALVATYLKDGTLVWRRDLGGGAPGEFKVFADGKYVLWTAAAGTAHQIPMVLRAADGRPVGAFGDARSVTPLAAAGVLVLRTRPEGLRPGRPGYRPRHADRPARRSAWTRLR